MKEFGIGKKLLQSLLKQLMNNLNQSLSKMLKKMQLMCIRAFLKLLTAQKLKLRFRAPHNE